MLRAGRALSAALALVLANCSGGAQTAESPRPPLHVLTGLPLFWGEGDIKDVIDGRSAKSPLVTALEADGPVIPIAIADAETLRDARVLLLLQPPALAPAQLVAIDNWVREGGAVLILADPSLAWPSRLPLGDPRRAPATSLLDPLLGHWGLELDFDDDRATIVSTTLAGRPAQLFTPGRWVRRSGDCVVSADARRADCVLGQGRAILVADADFVDPQRWAGAGEGNPAALRALIAEATDSASVSRRRVESPREARTNKEQNE